MLPARSFAQYSITFFRRQAKDKLQKVFKMKDKSQLKIVQ